MQLFSNWHLVGVCVTEQTFCLTGGWCCFQVRRETSCVVSSGIVCSGVHRNRSTKWEAGERGRERERESELHKEANAF